MNSWASAQNLLIVDWVALDRVALDWVARHNFAYGHDIQDYA